MASRLLLRDMLRLATIGLRTRRLRAALSVLGISIGIAALVAVPSISETSRADLLERIDRLGTNLLAAEPGESLLGGTAKLPAAAAGRIRLLPEVEGAAGVTAIEGASVRRSSFVPEEITGGITLQASDRELPTTLEGGLREGRFLDPATERYPAVVLGAAAARRLAITRLAGPVQVYVDGRELTVVGILQPLPLVPDIDSSALVGYPLAARLYGTDRSPTKIYVRAGEGDAAVRAAAALASAADPWDPAEVAVSRPSDALEARAAAEGAFTSLLLALGAVALLVGGIGIANVMIISVLERRPEVGLRRALGARRVHIAIQFLGESLLLGSAGGVAGVLLGIGATAAYAGWEGLTLLVPTAAVAGALLAACLLGGLAGLYPALRAARLTPTEALRST